MTRALVTIHGKADRERVAKWAMQAPFGTRVEFKATKRTLPQNDRFWAMLTDISCQVEHCGRKYTPDIWKHIMMQAWGREVRFIPTLSGDGVIPIPLSSSELSKVEMSDLIEFMFCEGAKRGIVWSDPASKEGLAA